MARIGFQSSPADPRRDQLKPSTRTSERENTSELRDKHKGNKEGKQKDKKQRRLGGEGRRESRKRRTEGRKLQARVRGDDGYMEMVYISGRITKRYCCESGVGVSKRQSRETDGVK